MRGQILDKKDKIEKELSAFWLNIHSDPALTIEPTGQQDERYTYTGPQIDRRDRLTGKRVRIKLTKLGKAGGIDNTSNELLRFGEDNQVKALTLIFN